MSECKSCAEKGKEIKQLRGVLAKMAEAGCEHIRYVKEGTGSRILWCPERFPDDKDSWCWPCIARAALDATPAKAAEDA